MGPTMLFSLSTIVPAVAGGLATKAADFGISLMRGKRGAAKRLDQASMEHERKLIEQLAAENSKQREEMQKQREETRQLWGHIQECERKHEECERLNAGLTRRVEALEAEIRRRPARGPKGRFAKADGAPENPS